MVSAAIARAIKNREVIFLFQNFYVKCLAQYEYIYVFII